MAEKIVTIADSITVGELAQTLNLPVTTLIGELFKNGIAATINQRIDYETASIIVEELGLDVELQKREADDCARTTSPVPIVTARRATTNRRGNGPC